MTPPRAREFIRRTGFIIDQYGFPIFIATFLVLKSASIVRFYPLATENFHRLSHINSQLMLSGFLSEHLIVFYNIITLWALLIRKKPLSQSETLPEIIIPLITIAAYSSINLLGLIPASLNPILIPRSFALSLSLAGSVFVLMGILISTTAMFSLCHSFAVLVQVRKMVSRGLYREVRHPVYLGYFVQMAGFLIAIPRLWTGLWVLLSASLFILRARLEERKIESCFPEYRQYRENTPFLLPWKIRKNSR
jgi:protein-S-isoprenylcysteine O-methyltransferase Ste14